MHDYRGWQWVILLLNVLLDNINLLMRVKWMTEISKSVFLFCALMTNSQCSFSGKAREMGICQQRVYQFQFFPISNSFLSVHFFHSIIISLVENAFVIVGATWKITQHSFIWSDVMQFHDGCWHHILLWFSFFFTHCQKWHIVFGKTGLRCYQPTE